MPLPAGALRHAATRSGVHYTSCTLGGDGSAPGRAATTRVVFAHANGFCRQTWFPVWEELGAGGGNEVSLLALDLTGHGGSKKGEAPWDWRGFAHDVLDVVDEAGAADAPRAVTIGVGHSMGGAALLSAELARPGTFHRLLLHEPIVLPPPYRRDPDNNALVQMTLRRRNAFDSPAHAKANYSGKGAFKGWDERVLNAFVDAGLAADSNGVFRLKCTPEWEAEMYASGSDTGLYDAICAVKAPVDMVAGATSMHLSATVPGLDTPGYVQMLRERLPEHARGRMLVEADAGHFMPMTHPQRMAALIARAMQDAGANETAARSKL